MHVAMIHVLCTYLLYNVYDMARQGQSSFILLLTIDFLLML